MVGPFHFSNLFGHLAKLVLPDSRANQMHSFAAWLRAFGELSRAAGCPRHCGPGILPGFEPASLKTTRFRHGSTCLRLVAAFAFVALCIAVPASAAEVDATLNRETVPAGNAALLTLNIAGSKLGGVEIPEVENLIIQGREQRRQVQSVNGQTSVSLIYTYVVVSETPGTYQIPPFTVTIDGQNLTTKPLTLKVLAAAATQPPAGSPPLPPGAGEPPDTNSKRFGFLTVDLLTKDRNYLYVGEIAPVRIRAWIPAGAQVQPRSGIQPEAKAFTLHNVSNQPQQSEETRDGKSYLVVTWFGGISATKTGTHPASLSWEATVAVRDTSALKPGRRAGSGFGDPLLDSLFDRVSTPMIPKEVTLKSDDQEIEVRPLPAAGRPAGFSGAVGNFQFDGTQIPAKWTTGEPQQVLARLAGSGNFGLLNAPQLTPPDAWKSYPGKSDITPGDLAAFSGKKTFQFSAVPRKGGAQKVALTFSFFDPATGTYQSLTSPPQEIQVSGADIADDPPPNVSATKDPDKPNDQLVGQHLVMSPPGSLVPLVARPAFIRLLGLAALLCLLGIPLAWLRHRHTDPARRARAAMETATRGALHAAARCADSRDVAGFFEAARHAIQLRLGALWNQPAPAITLAEISARIPAESPVARFFHEADLSAYGGHAGGDILPQWRELLTEAIASLTPTAR